MWQQCGGGLLSVLLLSFGCLMLGGGQEDLEEGILNKNEELFVEVEETDIVEEEEKEEMVGVEELEDLHLEVGRRVLVEGGLQVTLVKPGRRCRRKVVNGDLVAIQYEGRIQKEDGEVFHATEPGRPFVFLVRAGHRSPTFLFIDSSIPGGRWASSSRPGNR